MNTTVWMPDQLWHKWKRTFPHGDLPAFVRTAMNAAVKEQEAAEERARWAAHDRERGTAS